MCVCVAPGQKEEDNVSPQCCLCRGGGQTCALLLSLPSLSYPQFSRLGCWLHLCCEGVSEQEGEQDIGTTALFRRSCRNFGCALLCRLENRFLLIFRDVSSGSEVYNRISFSSVFSQRVKWWCLGHLYTFQQKLGRLLWQEQRSRNCCCCFCRNVTMGTNVCITSRICQCIKTIHAISNSTFRH